MTWRGHRALPPFQDYSGGLHKPPDSCEDNTRVIENYCRQESIPLAAKIPLIKPLLKPRRSGYLWWNIEIGPSAKTIEQLWKMKSILTRDVFEVMGEFTPKN